MKGVLIPGLLFVLPDSWHATPLVRITSPYKRVIEYDKFQKEWRDVGAGAVLVIGLIPFTIGLLVRSYEAVIIGIVVIAIAALVWNTRIYLRIHPESRTYESLKGLVWFQKPLTGSLEDFSSVEVGHYVSNGRYSSTVYFPVTVRWKNPAGHTFQIHNNTSFQVSASVAKEVADYLGVKVRETPELGKFRGEYRHAAYEEPEE